MQNSIIGFNFSHKNFYIFASILIVSIFIINSIYLFNRDFISNDYLSSDNNNLENNAPIWATLNLTNPSEINGKVFTLGSTIPIQGRLYNKILDVGKPDYEIEIVVNNINDSAFTDRTDGNGDFQIDYVIDPNLDLYSIHNISVIITNSTPGIYENFDYYLINVNITSYFEIISTDDPTIPKLTEEYFAINGYLRYSNGTGIPNRRVNYRWLSGPTTIISEGYFFTDPSGTLENVQVPITTVSQLTLNLSFVEAPYIDYSENLTRNIKIFSGIAWDSDIDYYPTEGDSYTVSGIIYSSTDSSLRINNRQIEIYYNGSPINPNTTQTLSTASDGSFSSVFQLPEGNGTATIQLRLNNDAGRIVSSQVETIFIRARPPSNPTSTDGGPPPFLVFSLIFFPIIASVAVALGIYGFFYYRKRERESRVVILPLESRIENLKILKDSGRLEEAISYLFNAVYMDLINAKYNRKRNINETIRDFAIISVKELKLTPSSIYPFIQKVEEIIYAKPFKIMEQDFYNTCELFSPIYFQLTGNNFILNF
ncbi:MAG: hypothetical protein ACFFDH_01570 [Promethearchaeota archaeon]